MTQFVIYINHTTIYNGSTDGFSEMVKYEGQCTVFWREENFN